MLLICNISTECCRFPLRILASVLLFFCFVLFFPFSHCYDCGSINTAWILPGPSYGLWLLLFFPLIPSICCTAERSSVAPTRLMLKICQPVMWWVFSSGGKIFTWAQQETVVGATSKWFSGCTHERVVISPEALQELIFQKNTPTGGAYTLFSLKISHSGHVNGNA